LGLPVPEIVLAENKKKKGSYIVIDGKQRLLTIRQFYSTDENKNFSRFKLSTLEILTELNGKTYSDLEKNAEFRSYQEALDNQSIRTVIIKNWPNDDFLHIVFHRLNTGSVALSSQELRQALHPGEFIDFSEQFSRESRTIQRMLRLKEPDNRMKDVELVIHYFAFKNFLPKYGGRYKKFLDDIVEELNHLWKEKEVEIKTQANDLNQAIDSTIAIFGFDDAFKKYSSGSFQRTFNRTVFEIMVYYFSEDRIRTVALNKKSEIKTAYIHLCQNDTEFVRSIEISTKNIDKVVKRYSTWGSVLSSILQIEISIPILVEGRIVMGSTP